ncbi:uncharacterized protein MELLADRAFT_93553 [Melampsora larici-populina 98AG31]|uniref:OTU domain-containing protein n=1 Tax=Melampsora larici-populina (strain 98AG31 / pathotype 3-4-7) TaxID=747676 RepID=F4RAU4_MELLP|nr:uncharacterized protein MELLADRAFT_93553 [Melampsora larici-populina 98AG31]EGG10537.1 hypothetical protein MELLADRAFT_93553 [Melampsora larici-populina 98AG31]
MILIHSSLSVIPETPEADAPLSYDPQWLDTERARPNVSQPLPTSPLSHPATSPHLLTLPIDFVDHEVGDTSFDLEALLPTPARPPNQHQDSSAVAHDPPNDDPPPMDMEDSAARDALVTDQVTHSSIRCPTNTKKRARAIDCDLTKAQSDDSNTFRRSTRQNPIHPTNSHTGTRRSTRHSGRSRLAKNVYGHCGYRAIAFSLGRTEDQWHSVRAELIQELRSKHEFYNIHFQAHKRGDGDVDDHIKAIQTEREDVLDTPALWLDSAQMMYIIATTYKRMFCVYSVDHSFSALPLDSPANNNPPIFLFFDRNRVHFLSLSISSPSIPIPEPWLEWHNLAVSEAKGWVNKFSSCFCMFKTCVVPVIAAQKAKLYRKNPGNVVDLMSD